MKNYFVVACCLVTFSISAQKKDSYPSSDSVTLKGKVSKTMVFTLTDLAKMADTSFASIKLVNHHGESKGTYTNVKAVSLSTLIDKKLITVNKPKELSTFYFVLKAADGYTVVYSYNELFGMQKAPIFIITAYNDLTLATMTEKPAILTTSTDGTGNVGLKGLVSIDVRKAD